jgi:hypothetical protein
VVSELYKALAHQGEQPILHHYRESRGLEMDVLAQRGGIIQTAGLPLRLDNVVIYGGETSHRSTARLLGWRDVGKILRQGL